MNPRQRRLAIIAAVNVLLLAVGWFALIAPQRSDAASAATQQQQVQNELAALTGTAPGSNKQPAIRTADLYALDTALPSQVDQTDLLFELDKLATTSQVNITNIAPQPATAGTNYTAVPINLSLGGSYFHITDFLRDLRLLVSEHQGHLIANGPLFAVTSVALSPGEADDKNGGGEAATVGLSAFYYGMVDGAAPPADTTTTSTSTTTTTTWS